MGVSSPSAISKEFVSAEQNIPAGAGTIVVAHGLGGMPKLWEAVLRNKTTEFNFAVNDEDSLSSDQLNGQPPKSITADAANLTFSFQDSGNFSLANKGTGAGTGPITLGNWKIILKAYR